MDALESFVFDQSKTVSYKWLSQKLSMHVNEAKRLLHDFAKKNGDKVGVHYLISGRQTSPGIPFHKVSIVPAKQLEEAKKEFKQIVSLHVYSVQTKRSSQGDNKIYNTVVYITNIEQQRQLYFHENLLAANSLRDNRWSAIENKDIHRRSTRSQQEIESASRPKPKPSSTSSSTSKLRKAIAEGKHSTAAKISRTHSNHSRFTARPLKKRKSNSGKIGRTKSFKKGKFKAKRRSSKQGGLASFFGRTAAAKKSSTSSATSTSTAKTSVATKELSIAEVIAIAVAKDASAKKKKERESDTSISMVKESKRSKSVAESEETKDEKKAKLKPKPKPTIEEDKNEQEQEQEQEQSKPKPSPSKKRKRKDNRGKIKRKKKKKKKQTKKRKKNKPTKKRKRTILESSSDENSSEEEEEELGPCYDDISDEEIVMAPEDKLKFETQTQSNFRTYFTTESTTNSKSMDEQPRKRTKRVLISTTHVNESGYLVTQETWKDVSCSESELPESNANTTDNKESPNSNNGKHTPKKHSPIREPFQKIKKVKTKKTNLFQYFTKPK